MNASEQVTFPTLLSDTQKLETAINRFQTGKQAMVRILCYTLRFPSDTHTST